MLTINNLKPNSNKIFITALCIFALILCLNTIQIEKIKFISVEFCLLIVFLLSFKILSEKIKIKISKFHFMWFLTIGVFIVSTLQSINFEMSLRFLFYYSLFVTIMLLLSTETNWVKFLTKFFMFFSSIHVIITLFSIAFTDAYYRIFSSFFSDYTVMIMRYLIYQNSYPGLAGQTGTNAFFISIGVAVLISKLSEKRGNKVINTLVLLVFIIALLSTQKRGVILSNVIAGWITMYVCFSSKKNVYFTITIFASIIMSLLLLLESQLPFISGLISKFSLNHSADYSSGRIELYYDAWEVFKTKPFAGYGINSFTTIEDVVTSAHNDFLQLLSEVGISGILFIVVAFMQSAVLTIKLIGKSDALPYDSGKDAEIKKALVLSLYIQVLFLCYSLVGNPFYNLSMLLTYFICISVPLGVNKNYKIQKNSKPLS